MRSKAITTCHKCLAALNHMYTMQVGNKSTRKDACADVLCKPHHVNTVVRVKKNSRGKFDTSKFEASYDLNKMSVGTSP
jgi:hypothetical protein